MYWFVFIAAGAEHGSGYSILTRSKTRAIAEQATKDTASSTPKPAQRAMPGKRRRADTSEDRPAQKRIAVSQAEVQVVPDVDAACTAMDVDQPSTTAATGRKRGGQAESRREHVAELLCVWDGRAVIVSSIYPLKLSRSTLCQYAA